jgi:hypothetical protein
VHQAFVQDAQHDVDHHDGREDQQRQDLLLSCAAWPNRKLPRTLFGMAISASACAICAAASDRL